MTLTTGRMKGIAVAIGACAALMLAWSGSAQAATGSTSCTGTTFGGEITTNVTVPDGASCALFGVTIDGNVSVGTGANADFEGDLIKGNLSTAGAGSAYVAFTTVNGNTSFVGTSGAGACGGFSICTYANSFKGNVAVNNNTPAPVAFDSNTVGGNLGCTGNSEVVQFFGLNTVTGNVSGQCIAVSN
jgi:hypothetical protein